MDFKEIQKIVELMNEHGLSQFKLEQDDTKLELKKGGDVDLDAIQKLMAASAVAPAAVAAPAQHAVPAAIAPSGEDGGGALPAGVVEIPSPMVGTFYSASDPESDAFVKIGSKITGDSTICIIEAMKVMNEIKAEIDGKAVVGEIVEILVENGSSVQFGDPIYRVKTS